MNKNVKALIVLLVFLVSIVPLTLARETRLASQGNDDNGNTDSEGDDSSPEIVAISDDEPVGTPPMPPRMQGQLEKLKQLKDKQMEWLQEKLQDKEQIISGLTPEEKAKLAALGRARIGKLLEENGNLKEALADFKLERMNARLKFRERVIGAADLEAAKQRYQEAAEKYQAIKKDYLETRKEFQSLKNNEDKCKDSNTTECNEVRNQTVEKAKEHLLNVADMVLQTIEKVKTRVNESEDINDTDAAAMIAKLNALESQVKAIKADINAATTKAELKDAGQQLIDLWKQANLKLRRDQARLFNGRMMRIINNADHLETKLDEALAKLEAKNLSVSDLEANITAFSDKVDKARELYKEGRALLVEAFNSTEGSQADRIQKAQDKFKEAHILLQEAHTILQALIKEINQRGGSLSEDDSGDEVVVEDIPALPEDDDSKDVGVDPAEE